MNEQRFSPFLEDAAFGNAGKRVLDNILVQFEDLSEDKLKKLMNTSIKFLGNNHIRDITAISYEIEMENCKKYTIGRAKFDKDILSKVCSNINGKWVISVDESIVDEESFIGNVAYRHSCAFGYKVPHTGTLPEERILAVSSILRIQDDENFENKMQFLPYLLNLYVAFYTAKILEKDDEQIFAVILHGPLIRQIAPFLDLMFKREEIEKVVTADTNPETGNSEIDDIAQGKLFDSIIDDPIFKEGLDKYPSLSTNQDKRSEIEERIKNGEIPGICFYFMLLRRLSDLAKKKDFYLISCVEDASRSNEYSRLYVQRQFEYFGQQDSDKEKILHELFDAYDISFDKEHIGEKFQTLIAKSSWDDEMIQAFSLKFDDESIESEFTRPVPIRRYFTASRNEKFFGFKFGCTRPSENPSREDWINEIINVLYPFEKYRMLMSFVRTSPLKTPIRVEFLEQGDEVNWQETLASIYVSSLPYSSYGLPIFLYYADKMARMPKRVISISTESYLFEQARKVFEEFELNDSSLREVILAVTKIFRRDFHDRG